MCIKKLELWFLSLSLQAKVNNSCLVGLGYTQTLKPGKCEELHTSQIMSLLQVLLVIMDVIVSCLLVQVLNWPSLLFWMGRTSMLVATNWVWVWSLRRRIAIILNWSFWIPPFTSLISLRCPRKGNVLYWIIMHSLCAFKKSIYEIKDLMNFQYTRFNIIY